MNLTKLTITEARRALDAKEYSAVELTDTYLKNIAARDGEIHAYLEVWEKEAREEAKKADGMIARGEQKPLTGIPVANKDNILVEGRIASSASKMLEQYRATYDATVITKLKEQGAVILGRTNMDEFAMGSSTETSAFGNTKNPRDLSRVPGGSSGGPAAAVAADMALVALGSDTGGSIRQPAALTGIVGMKPTYGAVSRFGLMALASSLDQIGPFAKTVDDARALFEAIRGHDKMDSTSLPDSARAVKTPKKLGIPRAFLEKGTEPDVLAAFETTLALLKEKGYEIVDIELPTVPHSLAVYYIIQPAEASTNLARYDGIRYGLSVPADSIQEVYTKTRGAGFGREVRRRILIGSFVLSSGYADAYYRKARALRDTIRAEFTDAFQKVDAVVMPTTPSPAFKFGEKSYPLSMYAEDVFATPANIAGLPAMSVPMGEVERDGTSLPTGFQIIAPHLGENTLFTIGSDVESTL
ncbi:Asp-tRNA(Asn)/Glu-tRNA(Gln) amidotransferase subunit GatA [Candidatus Parcubacteria bacterium]|nr:MAG: Asp-tRNA(Asn)/Glu-tRNA(Gln) amidotransferase subunit GatA [Candidatus Parcubacteria bacterium]